MAHHRCNVFFQVRDQVFVELTLEYPDGSSAGKLAATREHLAFFVRSDVLAAEGIDYVGTEMNYSMYNTKSFVEYTIGEVLPMRAGENLIRFATIASIRTLTEKGYYAPLTWLGDAFVVGNSVASPYVEYPSMPKQRELVGFAWLLEMSLGHPILFASSVSTLCLRPSIQLLVSLPRLAAKHEELTDHDYFRIINGAFIGWGWAYVSLTLLQASAARISALAPLFLTGCLYICSSYEFDSDPEYGKTAADYGKDWLIWR